MMIPDTTMIVSSDFFNRPTLTVAEELLGKYLVMQQGDAVHALMIQEVEAYTGPEDKACHASKGLTDRTKVMFGPAGCWYIYLIYGMYWMLNIVTEAEGHPSAVLIRGVGEYDGPGKLTKRLSIDKTLNGLPAAKQTGLWIEDRGETITSKQIKRTPRIGVDYAGEWAKKPYRFILLQ